MKTDMPSPMRVALEGLRAAFALVDENWRVIECSPAFSQHLGYEARPLRGYSLLELVPELVGQEDVLHEILRGERLFWRLENVNRGADDGSLGRYLTLVITTSGIGPESPLLILTNDVTERGRHLQQLMQSKNELRLTRRRLLRLNEQLEYLLRHYVPPQVADALLMGRVPLEPGGETRSVSLLFADARGFTGLAERLPPRQVVDLLNRYMDVIADAIDGTGGTVGQFQGDGVLAIFNAPDDLPAYPYQAVQAGIALQEATAALRARQPEGEPRLHFGVGISTGPALLGNVGARWRYTYTAIGDVVNLAARITAIVPGDEIWICAETRRQLPPTVAVEPLPSEPLEGRSQATPLFRVVY